CTIPVLSSFPTRRSSDLNFVRDRGRGSLHRSVLRRGRHQSHCRRNNQQDQHRRLGHHALMISRNRKGSSVSAILIALRSLIRFATSHARRIDMTRLDQTFNKLDYPPRPIENASMKKLVSLVCVSFMGMCAVGNLRAETQPADAERYGPYPTNYKEIVMKWLDTQLI